MPAEQAQIRLMTASPVTLRALIPAPDQVTPEQAYYRDLNFYKKTLFHTPFLSPYLNTGMTGLIRCPQQYSATYCPCSANT